MDISGPIVASTAIVASHCRNPDPDRVDWSYAMDSPDATVDVRGESERAEEAMLAGGTWPATMAESALRSLLRMIVTEAPWSKTQAPSSRP